MTSFAPLTIPLTVNVSPVNVWPASTALTEAPLNTLTAAAWVEPAASVKVGFTEVEFSTGASLTGVTVTVEAIVTFFVSTPPLAVPPVSTTWVSVTVRVAEVGPWLVFWYDMPLTTAVAALGAMPPALANVTVAVPAETVTV